MAFTDNLQALMIAKGISRRKLAKECGVSPSAVNSWFNRSAESISLPTLKKLSECFGASIEELVYGNETRRETTFSMPNCTNEELEDKMLDRVDELYELGDYSRSKYLDRSQRLQSQKADLLRQKSMLEDKIAQREGKQKKAVPILTKAPIAESGSAATEKHAGR